MIIDRTNPEHCPTCDTCEPCVHRATRSAHVAYREGRDAFNIPWSNRTPIDQIDRTCLYPEGTDDASWWHRGFQGEARMAVAQERRSTIIDLCTRVGVMVTDPRVLDGSHVVEAKVDDRWCQYAATEPTAPLRDRWWHDGRNGYPRGWNDWNSGGSIGLVMSPGALAARGRLVPRDQADQPPTDRGEIRQA